MQGKHFDLAEDADEARFEKERELILRYWNEEDWTEERLETELLEAGLIQPEQHLVNLGYPGRELASHVEGDVVAIYRTAEYMKMWGGSRASIDLFDAATGDYLAEPSSSHRDLYKWAEAEIDRRDEDAGAALTRSEAASYRADRELHRRFEDGELGAFYREVA